MQLTIILSIKCDAVEVTDDLLGKGDNVALFLFNDTLELCKRRGTARLPSSSSKSPSVSSMARTPTKSYKHLEILPLAHIKVRLRSVQCE